jgi:hypothetical protein
VGRAINFLLQDGMVRRSGWRGLDVLSTVTAWVEKIFLGGRESTLAGMGGLDTELPLCYAMPPWVQTVLD